MSTLPDPCGVAFKEWSGICRALAEGRQVVIVRKGGIADGPGGFAPEHPDFWLYPTEVHQAQHGLREGWGERPAASAPDSVGPVAISALAHVEHLRHLDSEDLLPALEPFHVWTLETLRKRFHYRKPGLWLLGVRVLRTDQRRTIIPTALQLGCKSWVPLDPPLDTTGLQPVLDDPEWDERMQMLLAAIEPGPVARRRSPQDFGTTA
jgi:hypothetical protein